jgi:hypothetical protein
MTHNLVSRRGFLRAAGVTLALPMFDATLRGAGTAATGPVRPRRRMVAVEVSLGLHGPYFFPGKAGRDYALSPHLQPLEKLRDDFTVFSGMSHPDVDGGHSAELCFLTAAPHPGLPGFRNTISLDQLAAETLSGQTRFDSLVLNTQEASSTLSWTRNGVRVPAFDKPSVLFGRLFLKGTDKEIQAQVSRLRRGRSIMDAVSGQVKELEGTLGTRDREKLDEYVTAVRECEKKLVVAQEWVHKPKPQVNVPVPEDIKNTADMIGRLRLMYDLMHLAIQTDSTRFITLQVWDSGRPVVGIPGDEVGWHVLSHHGQDPKRLEQLGRVELEIMKASGDFLTKLKNTKEEGESLLDRTMVLLGSSLGNASSHDTRNIPVMLAGGGFKHGQHLAFDTKNNKALGHVFVSMLQQLGLEMDRFGSTRGTLTELEVKRS